MNCNHLALTRLEVYMINKNNHKLFIAHFGRLYHVAAIFHSVKRATKFCELHPDCGVLCVVNDAVYISKLDDEGINHGYINFKKGPV